MIFLASGRADDRPRVWFDMYNCGGCCGDSRIAHPKRRRRLSDEALGHEHSIAPNMPDRQFEALELSRTRATDLTYLLASSRWLSYSVMIDLFGSMVVLIPAGPIQ